MLGEWQDGPILTLGMVPLPGVPRDIPPELESLIGVIVNKNLKDEIVHIKRVREKNLLISLVVMLLK